MKQEPLLYLPIDCEHYSALFLVKLGLNLGPTKVSVYVFVMLDLLLFPRGLEIT